ncbi:urease accessory protein UreE [Sphingomonas profundi]|uniref:urease accessory protein UreE n=1 Tax=Alterirhizorhabdus profundi TaxID=2681549 RepID=UPI0012E92788|nr:urease accessory protein UreE [Sphingomonas profundi]
MLRASAILRAGEWDATTALDRVTLDHDARHRRRFRYLGEGGTDFLLDLPAAAVLAEGDGLALDGGGVIAVAAADEPLIEVRAASPALLMRLAWHVGNRHLPADIGADRIRLRADHVIAAMLRGLGGTVAEIVAPFTPEAGAYAGREGGGHAHGHGHTHDHDHDHAHAHDRGHRHDH